MKEHSPAEVILEDLRKMGANLCTAESCTGGMLSAAITDVSGCSDVFLHGYVTYSNAAKREILGISGQLLDTCGAVSPETACEMASAAARKGCLLLSSPCLGLATTGVAGPSHSEYKPVGLVCIAAAFAFDHHQDGQPQAKEISIGGGRLEIRQQTVQEALNFAITYLRNLPPEALRLT